MQHNRLSSKKTDLFVSIYKKIKDLQDKGRFVYDLSVGQPTSLPFQNARKNVSKIVLSNNFNIHKYQDNDSPGVINFANKFIQQHIKIKLENYPNLLTLPTPGTKSMFSLVIMACGAIGGKKIKIGTMFDPGFPTPKAWCDLLNMPNYSLHINQKNGFRFTTKDIKNNTELIMINYPHNPSGQIATRKWLEKICRFCEQKGIRIFNDAAYLLLSHSNESISLSEVAVNYPNLSWAESFTASKLGNFTGWRVGAICGTKDFIDDIKIIKSNADSGFVAFVAAGVLNSIITDKKSLHKIVILYKNRLKILISLLEKHGMQLVQKPMAGFFTLWRVPKIAFNTKIKNATEFNNLMAEKTGIIGVPFGCYIRYAVVNSVNGPLYIKGITNGFIKARVRY